MEVLTKEYVRFMLNHIKELWAENAALKAIFKAHRDLQTRAEWESHLKSLMENPQLKKEIDDKFDPHIEKIMKALDDQEGVAALLRTPTKGLPN